MAAREPRWMPLSLAAKFEPMAADLGVSEVARSKRGFFTQYKKAHGRFAQLDPWWRNRRNNFVTRHMAQVRAHKEKLVDDKGRPTRRHLALIMWAYSPFPAKALNKMLREYEANPSDGSLVVWHGSPYRGIAEDFSNFVSPQGAVFFTLSESVAWKFSQMLPGFSKATGAAFAPSESQQNLPTVYKVALTPTRTFDMRTADGFAEYQEIREEARGRIVDKRAWAMLFPDPEREGFIGSNTRLPSFSIVRTIKPYLLARGYDSIWVDEGSAGAGLAMYDLRGKARVLEERDARDPNYEANPAEDESFDDQVETMSQTYEENPAPLSQEQIEALGQAYLKGVDISGTPRAQEMARAQANNVMREFEKLRRRVRVEFTERDPYGSFEELQADVVGNGHMWVFTGFSDTPLWSPEINWMARAVHDYDHVVANTDFSLPGEIRAYHVASARAPELEPLYLSEIALQAASFHVLGGQFSEGPQKLVFAEPSVARVAQQYERNESHRQMEAHLSDLMTVWDAAGALKTMTPEQLMQRMGAEGVPYDEAMLVVVSAILASDRKS